MSRLLKSLLIEAITRKNATTVANELKLDFSKEKFSLEDLIKGMNVELEHTDVTHGNLIDTAKIALAHLNELPDYYEKLEKYVENK